MINQFSITKEPCDYLVQLPNFINEPTIAQRSGGIFLQVSITKSKAGYCK